MEKNQLLDTSAVIDGHRGIITVFTVIEHPPAARPDWVTVIYPNKKDYNRAIQNAEVLRSKGMRMAATDLMISAIAANRGLALVTKDSDFLAIQKVDGKLKIRFIQ